MKKNSYIVFIIWAIVFTSCGTTKIAKLKESEVENALRETQYYRIFTDATKHALVLNSKKTAISMYNACIAEFPERAAPYYQLSSIYLSENAIPLAKEYAKRAEKRDTANFWYKIHLANIFQYENNYDSAAYYYEKGLEIKEDPEMKYNLAILYSKSGNPEKAIVILNELESKNVISREALMMKHNVYHNMKLYDSALVQLELLVKYFPDDPTNYGILAEYLSEIGRYEYAKEVYEDILRDDPENGLVLLSYAEFYMRRNIADTAFILYTRAVCCSDLENEDKISLIVNFINNREFIKKYSQEVIGLLDVYPRNNDFRLYAAYADVYINLQDYVHATPYLDSALMYEKNNFMLWEQTLLVNNYLERHEDVIRIAGECVMYFKDKPNVYFMRGLSEYELGNYRETTYDMDTIVTMKPELPMLLQTLNLKAEAFRQMEEYAESDSCYEEILRIDPENLMIRNNYAYYLSIREENLEKAKELSYLTIIREPENPTYLDTYGWIMFKMGQLKDAKAYIEKAIRNGAYNNAEVLDHYGDIMYKMDKCVDAIEAWEKVLEIDTSYGINDKLNNAKNTCQ